MNLLSKKNSRFPEKVCYSLSIVSKFILYVIIHFLILLSQFIFPFSSLPHCINEWTNDHVKSFFLHIGLQDTMLLLARHVDGPRLLQLYEMCLINRESMYQSLKFELNESFNKLLPISHYLTFLQQIAPYIPSTSRNTKTTHFPMIPYERCSLF